MLAPWRGRPQHAPRGRAQAPHHPLTNLQVMQKRALEHPKITVLWDSAVEEAYGNERVRRCGGDALPEVSGGDVRPAAGACKAEIPFLKPLRCTSDTGPARRRQGEEPEERRGHGPAHLGPLLCHWCGHSDLWVRCAQYAPGCLLLSHIALT